VSDDGKTALTVIAFVGSVFSPYYAFARRRMAGAPPENHVAINAVLYRPGAKSWAMTERSVKAMHRTADTISIGRSYMHFSGGELTIGIDEVTVPFPSRLHGTIRFRPDWLNGRAFTLDHSGRHVWQPFAPTGRVSAHFAGPGAAFEGQGYLDGNFGAEPLEAGFSTWNWSRGHGATHDGSEGQTIHYDWIEKDGRAGHLAVDCRAEKVACDQQDATMHAIGKGAVWRVNRAARAPGSRVVRTLEDTPFYTRSLIACPQTGLRVHESLDLERFSSRWVQSLLRFRMPRRA
jgi:carotenoid 1,2-hydratase